MLTLDANSVERLEVFLKLLQALGASLGWSLARRSILARSLYAGPASRQSRPVGIARECPRGLQRLVPDVAG